MASSLPPAALSTSDLLGGSSAQPPSPTLSPQKTLPPIRGARLPAVQRAGLRFTAASAEMAPSASSEAAAPSSSRLRPLSAIRGDRVAPAASPSPAYTEGGATVAQGSSSSQDAASESSLRRLKTAFKQSLISEHVRLQIEELHRDRQRREEEEREALEARGLGLSMATLPGKGLPPRTRSSRFSRRRPSIWEDDFDGEAARATAAVGAAATSAGADFHERVWVATVERAHARQAGSRHHHLVRVEALISSPKITETFERLDKDGDGMMEADEIEVTLRTIFEEVGQAVSPEEVRACRRCPIHNTLLLSLAPSPRPHAPSDVYQWYGR